MRTSPGLPNLRFHGLGHTAASLLLTYSAAKLSELKEILGHRQIAPHRCPEGHLVPGRPDTIRDRFAAALRDALAGSTQQLAC